MSITARDLAARFAAKHGVVGARPTRRTLPVLTADVPVGRPGWTLAQTCARCHRAPVLAAKLCARCHDLIDTARVAKLAAEQAFALVTR